jgi:hypothetical protein
LWGGGNGNLVVWMGCLGLGVRVLRGDEKIFLVFGNNKSIKGVGFYLIGSFLLLVIERKLLIRI